MDFDEAFRGTLQNRAVAVLQSGLVRLALDPALSEIALVQPRVRDLVMVVGGWGVTLDGL